MALTKVTSEVLADEFFSSSALSGTEIDWSDAAVFTKTLSAATEFTFTNVKTGMVKTLIIDGDQTITWPSGVKVLNGTYNGSATANVIQLISTNGTTDIYLTYSNYTAS